MYIEYCSADLNHNTKYKLNLQDLPWQLIRGQEINVSTRLSSKEHYSILFGNHSVCIPPPRTAKNDSVAKIETERFQTVSQFVGNSPFCLGFLPLNRFSGLADRQNDCARTERLLFWVRFWQLNDCGLRPSISEKPSAGYRVCQLVTHLGLLLLATDLWKQPPFGPKIITRWSPRTRMLTRMFLVQMSKHMVMQSRTIPFCNRLFEQSCACFPCSKEV